MPKLILLPEGDANLRAARRARDPADALFVIAHGTPQTVAGLHAPQLAAHIRASGLWAPGLAVRLDACRSGAAPDGVAAALARALGVPVWAPTSPTLTLGPLQFGPWHGWTLPGSERLLALWPGRWRCFAP